MSDDLILANPINPASYGPVIEDEDFIGSVAVAETTDDQAELDMDVLLGRTLDVDALVKRVAEPSRTRVDFAKLASVEDRESFDGSDNVIETLDTPDVPTYVAPPQRVEKGALDHELRKAARKPKTLTAWIKSELARGRTVDELVAYAEKSDPIVARDIRGCALLMDDPEYQDEE
jgi:hypothetical protein